MTPQKITAFALIADASRKRWVRVVRVEIVELWEELGGMVYDPRERVTYVIGMARLASRSTVKTKLRAVINSRPVTLAGGRSATTKEAGAGRRPGRYRGTPPNWYRNGQYA